MPEKLIINKLVVIEFNQKSWLKLYINMNIELRTKAENELEKDF